MSESQDEDDKIKSRLDKNVYLPPIYRLKMPETRTQTAKIRWLFELGYEVKDISKGLNVRYQQVRNMVTTQPKRAAREDLPPLEIELLELEDNVDALLDAELDRTFAESKKKGKSREPKKDGKPKGMSTPSEDDFGNEDVDNEDYGQH